MTCPSFCLARHLKASDSSVWRPCIRSEHDGGNHLWIEEADGGEFDRDRVVYVWKDATSMTPTEMTLWDFTKEIKPAPLTLRMDSAISG